MDVVCAKQSDEIKQIELKADNFRNQLGTVSEKLKSESVKYQKLESSMKIMEQRLNEQIKELQASTASRSEIPATPSAKPSAASGSTASSKETTPVSNYMVIQSRTVFICT